MRGLGRRLTREAGSKSGQRCSARPIRLRNGVGLQRENQNLALPGRKDGRMGGWTWSADRTRSSSGRGFGVRGATLCLPSSPLCASSSGMHPLATDNPLPIPLTQLPPGPRAGCTNCCLSDRISASAMNRRPSPSSSSSSLPPASSLPVCRSVVRPARPTAD